MMVLPQEDAGLRIGPSIKRPRSGRHLKVRRSRGGALRTRLATWLRRSTALARRFEAKLHCLALAIRKGEIRCHRRLEEGASRDRDVAEAPDRMLLVGHVRLLQPPRERGQVEPALPRAHKKDVAVAVLPDGDAEGGQARPFRFEVEIVDAREVLWEHP
jgi:hypothetical protein